MLRLITILLTLTVNLAVAPAFAQSASDPVACDVPHKIVPGDTLVNIASRAYGPGRYAAFYELNKSIVGDDPNVIVVGVQLNVPCGLSPSFVSSVLEADFAGTSETSNTNTTDTNNTAVTETETLLLFNRSAAPKFILNVGIVDKYLAQITEVTEGRVKFIDPPTIERDPRIQYDIVQSGEVDGAYIFNGHLAQSHPLLQLPMQPLMGGTAQQTALCLWHLHENHLSKADYHAGVQLLGFIGAPAAHIWRTNNLPLTPGENVSEINEYTVPYFDGLDTRGAAAIQQENAAWLAEFDESQGQSITMAMAHGAALAGGIWKDNNRAVTEIKNGVYTPTFSVILSDEAWDKISSADQAAILAISGEELAKRSAAWDAFDDGLRLKMVDMGLETVTAEKALLAELQDQSRIGLENWIAAADAEGISGYHAVTKYIEMLQTSHPTDK